MRRPRSSSHSLGFPVLMLVGLGVAAACGSSGNGTTFFGSGADSGVDGGGTSGGHQDSGGTVHSLGGDSGSLHQPDTGSGVTPPPPPVCDPSCVADNGTCSNGVCTITENPGAVTMADQTSLAAGGSADPSFTWLYPYDATVFPRGLISPTMQFGGTAPDAVLVKITFPTMSYTGYFTGASSQVQLSAATWTAITLAAGATSAVKVAVTKSSSGQVAGPVTETWTVAQGSMRGQIYYETYGSTLAGGPDSVGIMSIAPGAAQPTVLKSGCGNVCHTASADGSTLVANVDYPGYDGNSNTSASYNLGTGASVIKSASDQRFTYAGLYPDGSFAMSATNYRTWTGGASHLYDTQTGAQIAAPGWDGVVTNGGTVAFSPDGKSFAYLDESGVGGQQGTGQSNGNALMMASFDNATKTFSSLISLATTTSQTIAWPSFTPDGVSIVYHEGSNAAFETDAEATGDVYRVDIASKTLVRLDALDGYTASGGTYLPDSDTALSFAPTVLPEAVGGYMWVVFTSHRSYGNILPSKDNNDQNGKLWVAAIDLSAAAGKDSSHPAFYLDGQESSADNLRGFWVLPPCKSNGTSCATGDECCGGYCQATSAGAAPTCTATPVGVCSAEYDKCTASSDCCGQSGSLVCIGGFCSAPSPK